MQRRRNNFFVLALLVQLCAEGALAVVPQITALNVKCDESGMRVNVEFDTPFNGIIFSKGHFSDFNCRYVPANSNRNGFSFFIASSRCGTSSTERRVDGSVTYKNVLIIQNDAEYQERWDSAKKLSCDVVSRMDKSITFAPFAMDTLRVEELNFPGDSVDCWMDIVRGESPFAQSISGVVPIGEKLAVVIYIRDRDASFDVHVKDCFAYDGPDYQNPGTRSLQLTDDRGCTVREKLVKGFVKTRETRNTGATVIAYGVLSAFKFPEKMDVYLACNVEICKGGCESFCEVQETTSGPGSQVQQKEVDEDTDGQQQISTAEEDEQQQIVQEEERRRLAALVAVEGQQEPLQPQEQIKLSVIEPAPINQRAIKLSTPNVIAAPTAPTQQVKQDTSRIEALVPIISHPIEAAIVQKERVLTAQATDSKAIVVKEQSNFPEIAARGIESALAPSPIVQSESKVAGVEYIEAVEEHGQETNQVRQPQIVQVRQPDRVPNQVPIREPSLIQVEPPQIVSIAADGKQSSVPLIVQKKEVSQEEQEMSQVKDWPTSIKRLVAFNPLLQLHYELERQYKKYQEELHQHARQRQGFVEENHLLVHHSQKPQLRLPLEAPTLAAARPLRASPRLRRRTVHGAPKLSPVFESTRLVRRNRRSSVVDGPNATLPLRHSFVVMSPAEDLEESDLEKLFAQNSSVCMSASSAVLMGALLGSLALSATAFLVMMSSRRFLFSDRSGGTAKSLP